MFFSETGLDPKYLELELTESLLLTNADVMFGTLQELKDMGVMLAIDDFGTGYSSLGYLRQFKVNRLKIARTFIQDVSIDTDDAAITTAIINMAKALNLAVLGRRRRKRSAAVVPSGAAVLYHPGLLFQQAGRRRPDRSSTCAAAFPVHHASSLIH